MVVATVLLGAAVLLGSPTSPPRPSLQGPTIVGHRAMGSTHGPTHFSENSRTAISVAIAHLPAIEVDLRITKDGHAVVVHDALVQGRIWERSSDCEAWGKAIQKVTLSELRGCAFHNGDAVLDLSEFLSLLQAAPSVSTSEIFFDLKMPTESSREVLHALVEQIGRDLDPRFIPVFQARNKAAAQALVALRADGTTFPPRGKIFVLSNVAVNGKKWKHMGVDGLSINHRAITKSTAVRYQRAGLEVAVWTVSKSEVRRRLQRLPLDYLIADRP